MLFIKGNLVLTCGLKTLFIKFEFMITSIRIDQREKAQTWNLPLFLANL